MRAKAYLTFLFVCFCLLISACATRGTSAARFPGNQSRGEWSIDYNQKNAVPIKATFVVDDKLPPVKFGANAFLPYQKIIDEVTGLAQSSATGIVISHNGLILTNYHVVNDNPKLIQVMVGPSSKTTAIAKIVAEDRTNDLAVIKVKRNFQNIAHFGSPDDIRINQTIYYWGYPYGLTSASAGKCFHRGYISRTNVHIAFFSKAGLVRFYMGIRGIQGVSGSGIYNKDGRIIGVMQGYVASGLHFVAIPVNQVTEFLRKNHILFSD